MKLRLLIIPMVLVMLLCACGNADGKLNADLQAEIQKLEEENAQLKNQIAALQSGGTITDNTNTEPVNHDNITPVQIGETFRVGDVMEITLESSEWCDEIFPSNTSGSYSYYKDVSGEKFFLIKGELRNLSGEIFDIRYASNAQVLINEKYKATASLENEETDGKSFYGNIKPLQSLNLIIYASISDDLYDACESITLTMSITTDENSLNKFYSDDIPHETFTISFSKS